MSTAFPAVSCVRKCPLFLLPYLLFHLFKLFFLRVNVISLMKEKNSAIQFANSLSTYFPCLGKSALPALPSSCRTSLCSRVWSPRSSVGAPSRPPSPSPDWFSGSQSPPRKSHKLAPVLPPHLKQKTPNKYFQIECPQKTKGCIQISTQHFLSRVCML